MDGDGVVACGEAVVGGGGVAGMVFAIDEIIRCAGGVGVLDVDGACGAEIDMQLVQVVIISHSGRLKVDLVITMIMTSIMKNDFPVIGRKSQC